MTPKAALLPHEFRQRAFSTTEALAAGVSRSRLRRTDLVRPFHGTRVGTGSADFLGRCRSFRTRMDERHFFSHSTAARILGLPLPAALVEDGDLHVSTIRPSRALKARGVIGHQSLLAAEHLLRWGGFPLPRADDILVQLAPMLTLTELVQVGDALTRRQRPLATVEQLCDAAANAGHRPGVVKLRQAVALVRPRTDSPMETELRLAIVNAGLPEPVVNHSITDAAGAVVALGDLAFPEHRLVIEYDGDHHRRDRDQYVKDIDRLWRIEECGWRVVRINATHMEKEASEAVLRVRSALVGR